MGVTDADWDLPAKLRAELMPALLEMLERVRLNNGKRTTDTGVLIARYR